MEKLGKGLDEVDRKVEGLRKKFEHTTTEAAKLRVELDKATETIEAAGNLVGKLEGEYQRWNSQVAELFFLQVCVMSILGLCATKASSYSPTLPSQVVTRVVFFIQGI